MEHHSSCKLTRILNLDLSITFCHNAGVDISEGALMAAASLSARYISGRFLPDKAIDLMDEATAQVR